MGTDNRKIQIETVVDASGARSGFDAVKDGAKDMAQAVSKAGEQAGKGVDSIGNGAAVSAEKFTRAESQIAASIQRRTALLASAGKGERAYQEERIKAAGLDVVKFAPALSALEAAEAKTKTVTHGLNTMGMSAKQFSASMRGVPAQFTDIITSLQSGQRPLTVLMQQGGQLKDMFGGVGNAAKALGGYVIGLINPFTIAAGAAAALGAAYFQGAKESDAFNKALILSGNAAGTSAGQLADMARKISSSSGETVGSISGILNEIAATGKVSADVIGKVAKASVDMARAGGAAASETVKEFAALGDSPVSAILKLNDKYHFLTESVYTQIQALEDQGRATDAAKLAQSTYADAIESRIPSLNENLGLLERAWRSISSAAKGAWDSMADIGREKTLDQQLQEAIAKKNGQFDFSAGDFGKGALIAAPGQDKKIATLTAQIEARDRAARRAAADQRVQDEAIAGKKSLDVLVKGLRSKEEQIKASNEKIAREAAAVNAATPGSFSEKQIAELQKSAADKISGTAKKTPSSVSTQKSELAYDLAQIKQASEEQLGMYSNAEKIMQAMRSANLIEEGDYYEAKASFIRLNSGIQEDELIKQIDRMKREKLSGKDKIDNDKNILNAESKLAKLRADTTAGLLINSIQQQDALDKVSQAYADARSSAESYLETVARQNERTVAGIGQGNEFRSDQSAKDKIEDKFTSRKTSLDDDRRRKQITQETYDTYLKIAEETYNKELAMHSETRNKILSKQEDWTVGMTEALANYSDTAKNVAQQTSDMFSNAFKGMEDAFVNFVKTGKLDFNSFAESIIADLARMQFKAAAAPITAGISDFVSGLFANADGGVYKSPSLSAFSGGVYNSPKLFKFASGAGVFGEAGPEAIMPLKRGPDGKLGVSGSGGAVTVNVINNANGTQATQSSRQDSGGKTIIDVMIDTVKGAIAKDIGSGGMVAGAMETQYGLNRAAGAWR